MSEYFRYIGIIILAICILTLASIPLWTIRDEEEKKIKEEKKV